MLIIEILLMKLLKDNIFLNLLISSLILWDEPRYHDTLVLIKY